MNIHTKPGTKVVFSDSDAGHKMDQKNAKKHLTLGETYTVGKTIIHKWHTEVFLEEIPNVAFNSVQFTKK